MSGYVLSVLISGTLFGKFSFSYICFVSFLVQPKITYLNNQTVSEFEEQVTLTCEASGDPTPTISWSFENRVFSEGEQVLVYFFLYCTAKVNISLSNSHSSSDAFYHPDESSCPRASRHKESKSALTLLNNNGGLSKWPLAIIHIGCFFQTSHFLCLTELQLIWMFNVECLHYIYNKYQTCIRIRMCLDSSDNDFWIESWRSQILESSNKPPRCTR